ncbi:MAG: asparagine synthase (glutamine-hydrolyzing) [Pseudomonas sp.]|uniref:asparagine synthase (glutamine-hydrolyzing) n=1 Tax=Pseudomonas TaxID=286 RepID=UPI0003C06862|nr:asparagine synthase (glutamine-hydrolyzing) [Pseudomonas sp. VLB120]AGZ34128.1 asparagine synthetase (WbpS) [Pseudomonas sp. VLB120]
MCGLSGYLIASGADAKVTPETLLSMIDKIKHRGPDSLGVWVNESKTVGLSHARLSIVELSEAGHQPMISACGRYVIAFNGEIYNHLHLRKLLQNEGNDLTWRGGSDTETLLACISVWGLPQTLKATVGMFSIALWDQEKNTLTLARDRFGEKPLYWGWQGKSLIFGSELKAIKAHPDFQAKVDRGALALLVRHNYIPAPHSIYEGVEKLLPGHFVVIDAALGVRSYTPQCYWDINSVVSAGLGNQFSGSDDEAVSSLEVLLNQAISGQMLADVPLGAFLSGGIDSSVIVALMQAQSSSPVSTFTIGFDEPGYNEAEHALAVSKHLRTAHTEVYVAASDALKLIPSLPSIYCEPFADSSQIPTFLVSEMARQHVTVVLSGDAGDELFGGYNPYRFAPRLWRKLSYMPASLRRLVCELGNASSMPTKIGRLIEICDANSPEDFYRKLISQWKRPQEIVVGSIEPTTLLNQKAHWPLTDCFEHWMMAVDAQTYMVDDILVKVDRASMANSLEARVPFLDHRIFEFAWRLPLEMKIRGGKGKWILRELLYRHVPQEMIERPKKGFSIPLGQWLRGPLRDWAEMLLDNSLLEKQGYFNSDAVRKVWLRHLEGKVDLSRKLWSILMFQAWLVEQ